MPGADLEWAPFHHIIAKCPLEVLQILATLTLSTASTSAHQIGIHPFTTMSTVFHMRRPCHHNHPLPARERGISHTHTIKEIPLIKHQLQFKTSPSCLRIITTTPSPVRNAAVLSLRKENWNTMRGRQTTSPLPAIMLAATRHSRIGLHPHDT